MSHYRKTTLACYIGYMIQAIVNCLPPLLYTAFYSTLGISLGAISLLILVNFGVQIAVDLASAFITDRIGYRAAVLAAHLFVTVGLLSLGILPFALPPPFLGLLIATVLSAIGGGLIEVVVSPIIEALPTERKASSMVFLHSFYCWGHVAVVLLSTLYFSVAGIGAFRWLPVLWAVLPALNFFLFLRAPLCQLGGGEKTLPVRKLFRERIFWLLSILMLAAGASELAMGQWASFFAERALGVEKATGDLLGPCLFAALMGIGRVLGGILGGRVDIRYLLAGSAGLSIACYLTAALAPSPVLSLLGCAFCGLSVALMWPGLYSLGARLIPAGGTAMFALFALAGDAGCTSGPTLVGLVSGNAAEGLRTGLLLSAVFPALMLAGSLYLSFRRNRKN